MCTRRATVALYLSCQLLRVWQYAVIGSLPHIGTLGRHFQTNCSQCGSMPLYSPPHWNTGATLPNQLLPVWQYASVFSPALENWGATSKQTAPSVAVCLYILPNIGTLGRHFQRPRVISSSPFCPLPLSVNHNIQSFLLSFFLPCSLFLIFIHFLRFLTTHFSFLSSSSVLFVLLSVLLSSSLSLSLSLSLFPPSFLSLLTYFRFSYSNLS